MVRVSFHGFAALPVQPTAGWWETLELPPTASRDEIEASYRRQVKRHHPDVGGDREAFERVQEAYRQATVGGVATR